jgi:hypothetical protein
VIDVFNLKNAYARYRLARFYTDAPAELDYIELTKDTP